MGAQGHRIGSIGRRAVRPFVSRQTYKNLLYLALGIPLALFYWMVVGFGLMAGVILVVVLVGLGVLLVTVLAARVFTAVERWIANRLLPVSIRSADDVPARDGRWGFLRRYLDAPSTWRGLGFLTLKFWFAIIGFLLLYGLYQGIAMISTIVRRPVDLEFGEVNGEPVTWTIETVPEVAMAVPIGVVLVLVALLLTNAFAYVAARMAEALLGEPP